jgi:hypothetical protein
MRLTIWLFNREVLAIEFIRHDSQQMLAETMAGFLDESHPHDDDESLSWPEHQEDRVIFTGIGSDDTSEIPSP